MKTNFLLILLSLISFDLISKDYSDLKASKATLTMKGGEMDVWMTKKENNLWEMKSIVDGGRVFERKEISVFELNQKTLIPLDHNIRMRILFKKIKSSASFDWKNLKVDYQEGKDKGSIRLIDGTLGPATAQLQMRLDLRNLNLGSLPKKINYLVYFRGEIKKRTYKIEESENIKTPMGEYRTIKLSRQFPSENKKEQIYWFAPELDFSIVRILNTDKRSSDLTLQSFEFID